MSAPNSGTAAGRLAQAFTREHHQIDEGIENYIANAGADPHARAQSLLSGIDALRRHIYLEEAIVFPHLPQDTLMMPLMVMHREHGELWRRMNALEASLRATTAPEQLETSCQELLSVLEQHNSKEEPIIYPYMDTALSPEEQSHLESLLDGGGLPEGWVCKAA
ncbi:hemerythrin domain-containing protein [Glutamicibacter arilaitensis]|uniref:Hemerythrin domain-containing protein n=2 Tax=Glutamicibacter arilaitensis TaxID=256701 RepID=A0A2N7S7E2_9MICC|nr:MULTISPECIES: hemerythrin domain-containing protein [Glutamicibacter]PMQ22055.1 hemerythrin domain-containing protein [Glutamicibacter arilaitensis]CBT75208.1 cation binding domain-containing protein [Glutamicibacter arilaitensis Re117]HCH48383.1 hemerythrin domain-containing protein [Glutamicibacter sp.]HCJ55574.1 hemerythrin domain-containing protein [Glutamicibacter sp.]HCM93755.1 hemerythrin domain-containing protein [Glutamicibacter sp.]